MPDPPVCVYCRRRPVDARWRPFCSERCQLFDLARWVDGDYRIPGEAVSETAGPEESDARPRAGGSGLDRDPDDRP